MRGVDDAVLKEHARAITAHHGGVGHLEDDSCVVPLTGLRQGQLRGRTFCENNMGRGLSLSSISPSREETSGNRPVQSVTSSCLQLLRSGSLGWQGNVLTLLSSSPWNHCSTHPQFQNSKELSRSSIELG